MPRCAIAYNTASHSLWRHRWFSLYGTAVVKAVPVLSANRKRVGQTINCRNNKYNSKRFLRPEQGMIKDYILWTTTKCSDNKGLKAYLVGGVQERKIVQKNTTNSLDNQLITWYIKAPMREHLSRNFHLKKNQIKKDKKSC